MPDETEFPDQYDADFGAPAPVDLNAPGLAARREINGQQRTPPPVAFRPTNGRYVLFASADGPDQPLRDLGEFPTVHGARAWAKRYERYEIITTSGEVMEIHPPYYELAPAKDGAR